MHEPSKFSGPCRVERLQLQRNKQVNKLLFKLQTLSKCHTVAPNGLVVSLHSPN